MLWTLVGVLIGYAMLGGIVSNLVGQLMSQAQSSLGGAAATTEAVIEDPLGMEEEEPLEEDYEEEF